MSNEVKIGILAVVTFLLLFWSYRFVQGRNILESDKMLYAEYDDVAGLREGTTVSRSGVKVGTVTAVYLKPEDLKTVIIEMTIKEDLPIPKSTIAQITSTDFLGEKRVILQFDGPCNGANCANSGDYLAGSMKGIVANMIGSPDEVGQYVDVVKDGMGEVLDSLSQSAGDENSAIGKTMADVDVVLQNLKATTASLNSLINRNAGRIDAMVSDVEVLTNTLEKRNSEIESIIVNADTFSKQLSGMDLSKTLESTEGTISSLNATLASTDKAIGDLSGIITQVKEGDGTMAKLINDSDLYDRLNRTAKNVDLLMQDVRLNPKRYTTILRKKAKEYALPNDDPAFQGNGN